jgi:hypothetical protein
VQEVFVFPVGAKSSPAGIFLFCFVFCRYMARRIRPDVLGWAFSIFQTRKVYTGVKTFRSIPQKQTPPHGLLVKRRLKKPARLLRADDVLFTFIYLRFPYQSLA